MLVSAEISLTQTQGKEKRFRGSKTTEKIIILGKLCIFLRKTSWKSVDFLFLNCAGLPHEAWCFDSQIHGEVVTMLTESMSLLFHGHPCGLISKLHSFNKPHWTMHYSYSLSSITGSLSLPIWQNHDSIAFGFYCLVFSASTPSSGMKYLASVAVYSISLNFLLIRVCKLHFSICALIPHLR